MRLASFTTPFRGRHSTRRLLGEAAMGVVAPTVPGTFRPQATPSGNDWAQYSFDHAPHIFVLNSATGAILATRTVSAKGSKFYGGDIFGTLYAFRPGV